VHVDAPAGYAVERGERPVFSVDWNVTHATAGLGTGSGRDHLIIAKECAVEKDDVGLFDPGHDRRGHCRDAGDIDHACVVSVKLDADITRSLARTFQVVAFEIERHFAWHCEQLRLQSSWKNERRCGNNSLAFDHVGREHAEHHILRERGERDRGGA
jgi:hypothetical protein